MAKARTIGEREYVGAPSASVGSLFDDLRMVLLTGPAWAGVLEMAQVEGVEPAEVVSRALALYRQELDKRRG